MSWLRQYWAVSKNAFVITLGDPIYLVMLLTALVLMLFFASLPTFAFGQETQLIRDQSLALLFIAGCLVSCIGAATVVVRDLRLGAISVLMSRPVSSFGVVAGKWTGLAGALGVFTITVSASVLWISKISGNSSGEDAHLNGTAMTIYILSLVLPLLAMAIKHYFFGGWYVWQANVALFVVFLAGFLLSAAIPAHGDAGIDWSTGQGCLMLFLAQLIFSAMLFPFAVKVDTVTLLVVGVVVFALGLVAEYMIATTLGRGSIGYGLVMPLLPNWQPYWLSDMLTAGDSMSVARLATAVVHTVAYVAGCLGLATLIFNRREFSGTDVV